MPFRIDHPIPILMEDNLVHTDEQPVYSDVTCPDTGDHGLCIEALEQLVLYYEDGLLTSDEATRLVLGRQL
jgi:hypothetical protein